MMRKEIWVKDSFYKKVLAVSAVLLVSVALFIFLNQFTTPHATNMQFTDVNINSSRAKITFNVPLDRESAGKNLHITPDVKYTTSWVGSTLHINFNGVLEYAKEYTIELKKDTKDVYGRNLTEDLRYSIRTRKAELAFIKQESGKKDQVVITDHNLENERVIYSFQEIKQFVINKNFLAAVIMDNNQDDLVVKNLRTGTEKRFGKSLKAVTELYISPTKNEIAYLQHDIELIDGIRVQKDVSRAYIYNLDTGRELTFTIDKTTENISYIRYSLDGNSLLYKAEDAFFYLGKIESIEAPIQLGRHIDTGGFNRNGSKILFLTDSVLQVDVPFAYLIEVDANGKNENATNGTVEIYDAVYMNRSDKIILAQKIRSLPGTQGIFKISQLVSPGTFKSLYEVENGSVELPKLSKDDQFIAIERYSEEEMLDFEHVRIMGFQAKPASATLIIYDVKSGTVIDKGIKGVNAQWLD